MSIYINILLEFLLISSSILLLFKNRKTLGLAPLYLFLGAVQYLQALSGKMISFELFGEIPMYPGSVILFTAVLFAVLLIYIKEGVASARALILGIIISNLLLTVFFGLAYEQEMAINSINGVEQTSIFFIDYKYFITGTVLLLIDFILLVIVYQFLYSKLSQRYYFITLFISLTTILVFDAVSFNLLLNYGTSDFSTAITGHIIGKTVASLIYTCILYIYLKHIDSEKGGTSFITEQVRDVFSIINFRKEGFGTNVDKKLVSQIERTLNNISDGFVLLDTNWCYTYVNVKAGEFLGRDPEHLIGKHIWTEFPEGVGLPFYDVYYKAVETQQTQYFEEYYEPFDKWFENRIYPSPNGLTIYFTDITEKKQANTDNQMLRSLIETSDEFIGLASLEGKPIYLNANGKRLVNLDKDIKNYDSIRAFFPDSYQNTVENKYIPAIFKTGKWKGEAELKSFKTGDLIPVEISGFLIKDETTNTPMALGIVAKDITERKEAEKEIKDIQSNLKAAMRIGKIGYWSWDIKKDEITWSDLMYSLYDVDKSTPLKYSTILERVHPDDIDYHNKLTAEKIETKDSSPFEYRVLRRDKSIKYIVAQMEVITNTEGEAIKFRGTLIDITDLKKAELELAQHKNRLEEQVEIRTAELEKEKVKAQSADLMKSAFLATMSHELRTPMNSIIGFTGILLKELAGPLNDEQKKQLAMVNNSGEHLLGLINDVLDISKIEAGKLKVSFYPFDYLASVERTIDFLLPQAEAKGLKITTEIEEMEITLQSAERRVEQILLNLLSNAIKFSKKGTITVKISVEDEMVVTQVKDQGIGITEDDMANLFMPFIQVETGLNRSHDGTGLGLAICKNLVEMLGGIISVNSKLGIGSNFSFKLPLVNSHKK